LWTECKWPTLSYFPGIRPKAQKTTRDNRTLHAGLSFEPGGASTPHNPADPTASYRDSLILFFYFFFR
jgi:hypothetical protein